jgi:hypothetical protein
VRHSNPGRQNEENQYSEVLGCGDLFKISTNGTFTSLFSFDDANGANPNGVQLVQARDGNLYGTTENGGPDNVGTIFCLVLPLLAPDITSPPVNVKPLVRPGLRYRPTAPPFLPPPPQRIVRRCTCFLN